MARLVEVLILLFLSSIRSFSWTSEIVSRSIPCRHWEHRFALAVPQGILQASAFSHDSSSPDASNDDEDDDEGGKNTPYGSRSLSWTNRYRKLLPYENARAMAMCLGLRSPDEWEEHLQDGNVSPYMPNRPDEMYAEDWVSWEEFLGISRTYDEARQLIRILKIGSMDKYTAFVKADSKRAEGLRLPLKPEIVYRDKGWVSEKHFLGMEDDT